MGVVGPFRKGHACAILDCYASSEVIMRAVLLAFACLALASCASTVAVTPREEIIDRPSLNKQATVEVGETLVAKGKRSIVPAITTSEPIETWAVTFPAQTFVLGYESEKHDWYLASRGINPWGNVPYPPGQTGLCLARNDGEKDGFFNSVGNCSPQKDGLRYERTTALFEGKPGFTQELIYAGRSGTTIRVLYREFVNDTARPAFSQEITYDLNDGSEIGFKGVRIEVLEATNTKITYKVLASFPDP